MKGTAFLRANPDAREHISCAVVLALLLTIMTGITVWLPDNRSVSLGNLSVNTISNLLARASIASPLLADVRKTIKDLLRPLHQYNLELGPFFHRDAP